MASAEVYNGGLGAEPPAGSRGRAHGQGARERSPLKLKAFTIRYEMLYFYVRSKADISQLNLPKRNRQLKKCKNRRKKLKSKKTDMLRSSSKQSGKSIQ